MLKKVLGLAPRREPKAREPLSRTERAVASLLASTVVASGVAVAAVVTSLGHGHVRADLPETSVVSVRSTGLREDPFDPDGVIEATRGSGSGFVVAAPSGALYVLTNSHVVRDAVGVFLDDDGAPSSVVYADARRDVAAILVSAPPASAAPAEAKAKAKAKATRAPATLCEAAPKVGTEVAAVGDPFGLRASLSRGVVSGLHRAVPVSPDLTLFDMVQTDALLNPGNSGGPLVDLERGCVLGMNTVIMTQPDGAHTGIGFAVPSRVLSNVVRRADAAAAEAEADGRTGAREERVGLPFSLLPDAVADALGVGGAVVVGVEDGAPLEGAYRDALGRPFVRDIVVGFRSGCAAGAAFAHVASAGDLERLVRAPEGERGFSLPVVRGDAVVEIPLGCKSDT